MARPDEEYVLPFEVIVYPARGGGFIVRRRDFGPEREDFIRTTLDEALELVKELLTEK